MGISHAHLPCRQVKGAPVLCTRSPHPGLCLPTTHFPSCVPLSPLLPAPVLVLLTLCSVGWDLGPISSAHPVGHPFGVSCHLCAAGLLQAPSFCVWIACTASLQPPAIHPAHGAWKIIFRSAFPRYSSLPDFLVAPCRLCHKFIPFPHLILFPPLSLILTITLLSLLPADL